MFKSEFIYEVLQLQVQGLPFFLKVFCMVLVKPGMGKFGNEKMGGNGKWCTWKQEHTSFLIEGGG